MSRKAPKPRIAWQDRYERPALDDLLSPLLRHHAQLIAQARDAILALDGTRESIGWQGVSWRWALTFSTEADSRFAYIIPQPGKPILALPLQSDSLSSLPLAKLSRAVRDAIQLASRVGDACWPQWELTSKSQVDEILQIVRRKHEMILSATA